MPCRRLYGLIYSDERQQAIFITSIFAHQQKAAGMKTKQNVKQRLQ